MEDKMLSRVVRRTIAGASFLAAATGISGSAEADCLPGCSRICADRDTINATLELTRTNTDRGFLCQAHKAFLRLNQDMLDRHKGHPECPIRVADHERAVETQKLEIPIYCSGIQ